MLRRVLVVLVAALLLSNGVVSSVEAGNRHPKKKATPTPVVPNFQTTPIPMSSPPEIQGPSEGGGVFLISDPVLTELWSTRPTAAQSSISAQTTGPCGDISRTLVRTGPNTKVGTYSVSQNTLSVVDFTGGFSNILVFVTVGSVSGFRVTLPANTTQIGIRFVRNSPFANGGSATARFHFERPGCEKYFLFAGGGAFGW